MVARMKKMGVDVASHMGTGSVLNQVIEFNADYVLLQSHPSEEEAYKVAITLRALSKPPKVIFFKKGTQSLDPASLMKGQVIRVFNEPVDIDEVLIFLLESEGYDSVELFNKYLKLDISNKKQSAVKERKTKDLFNNENVANKIPSKFRERDYLSSLEDFKEGNPEAPIDKAKVLEFQKNRKDEVNEELEAQKEKFLKALLMGDG